DPRQAQARTMFAVRREKRRQDRRIELPGVAHLLKRRAASPLTSRTHQLIEQGPPRCVHARSDGSGHRSEAAEHEAPFGVEGVVEIEEECAGAHRRLRVSFARATSAEATRAA